MAYKVTAALVVAADVTGKLRHFYADSVIPWLSDEQAAHFLRHGLVEELQAPEAPEAPSAASVPAKAGKPAKTASDEAWIEYGVSQGNDRDELVKLSKAELRELLG